MVAKTSSGMVQKIQEDQKVFSISGGYSNSGIFELELE